MEGRIQAIVTSQRRLSSKTFTHAPLLSVLSETPRPKKAGQKKNGEKKPAAQKGEAGMRFNNVFATTMPN